MKFNREFANGVRVGFKFPDGNKVEYSFPAESTVKVYLIVDTHKVYHSQSPNQSVKVIV